MKLNRDKLLKELLKSNNRLIKLLKEFNIDKLNIISCGNSIASGFSFSSETIPLLLRNESLKEIADEKGIKLERYHFARAEDNNDEHIYSWLINDIPLSEIHALNRFDITAMNEIGMEGKEDEYYPLDCEVTLNQLLKNPVFTNVIVYNGATGSFLDNVTRGGKHFFTYGVKRDYTSIEAFLKYIQEINREQGLCIQVYLCGAPKLFKASDIFINKELKRIARKYSNVVYVENIKRNHIYNKPDNSKTFDVHYNYDEYLLFNNQIIQSIYDNYLLKDLLIEIDRTLFQLNKDYQLGNIEKEDIIKNFNIDKILMPYKAIFIKQQKPLYLVKSIIKEYLLSRVPYDYYYVGKKNIKKM